MFGYKLKIYLEEKRLKNLFIEFTKNLELTEKEAQIIWETSKKLNRDPYLSLEIKQTFEKIIDYYIKNNPDFDESKIRHMRKVLGFDYVPPFIPLTTSKDIELYQSGVLKTEDGSFNVALVDKDELYMYWAILDPVPVRLSKGDKVDITFLRNDDAIYSFEDTIEEIYKEKDRYIIKLPHVFHLNRIQKRKDIRIKVNIPVEVHLEDLKINAETEDISLGGVKFCIDKSENNFINILKIGKYIYMKFEVNKKLIQAEGKIRNIVEKEDKVCFGIEFIDLNKEYSNILNEFISEKQSQLIQQYKKQKG
jgi:c-di-GMP-binding flagellar brake protein YcgR